jgi:hypothetical protein
MFVDQSTWTKLKAKSAKRPVDDVELEVPDPLHLAALKLHAARQQPARRQVRDWMDIDELIVRCQIDVRADEFREIVLRYADAATYERFLQNHPPR